MDDFISIKYKKFCHFIHIIYRCNYIFANPIVNMLTINNTIDGLR